MDDLFKDIKETTDEEPTEEQKEKDKEDLIAELNKQFSLLKDDIETKEKDE